MSEVVKVKLSPNRLLSCMWSDLEIDFSESLNTLKEKQKDTLRVVVYCRTLVIGADLFSHFSYEMGKIQCYPPSAPELSENCLLGMFHGSTPQHSKDVIREICKIVMVSVCLCGNGDGNIFTWSSYNHPLWCSKQY